MAVNTSSARDISPNPGELKPGFRPVQKGVFRKEGVYWTVGYGGKAFRLKDVRGLGYISHLLRHPGAEFHVLDLYGGIASQREEDETRQSVHGLPRDGEDLENAGIHITGLGDASETLINLANRIAQLPVVIIGIYRDGLADSNRALVRTLEELMRLGIRR